MDSPVSVIFLGLTFLSISGIICIGYLTLEEEKKHSKGINIYWSALCCPVCFLIFVLRKRAVTRLVRELPTGGVVSRDRGYRTDFLAGSVVHSLTATRNISRHECSKRSAEGLSLF